MNLPKSDETVPNGDPAQLRCRSNLQTLVEGVVANSALAILALFLSRAMPLASAANDSAAGEEMVLIPAGSFVMGSPSDEPGRLPDEIQHRVSLSRPFYLGRTEVTWSRWNEVRNWGLKNGYSDIGEGYNGFSSPEVADHPVTNVSWWDAIRWCNARSEMEGRKPVYYSRSSLRSSSVIRIGMPTVHVDWEAEGYRLPTEAEWEYACRAGSESAFYTGDITVAGHSCLHDSSLHRAGWYCGNSGTDTHAPAQKPANDFGLHDLHGNVFEWCWDWYGTYGEEVERRDPAGPFNGTQRIMRGGSWMNTPPQARSAFRHALAPSTVFYTIGFRAARSKVN